jgi:hypothetical protein
MLGMDNRSDCELLAPLRQFHPNLDYHLTLISQLARITGAPNERALLLE